MWQSSSQGETSPETKPAGILGLYLQPIERRKNKFLLCEPLSLWYFVMATLAD